MTSRTPNRRFAISRLYAALSVIYLITGGALPASADESKVTPDGCGACNINYTKLNLSQDQKVKIQQYDQEWFEEYQKTQPELQGLQEKFKKLLASPQADGTEIIIVQQQIDAKKSKLRSKATQVLIKKRQLLDGTQNKTLDGMIAEEILKRRQNNKGIDSRQPVRWQKLLNNFTNIFPQGQE